ncbi:MAG: RagB/SusD family nutrient uptake outer membrane protein [Salinivirgaceae bacterium]|nr:RagB/SusD family nutrient uptake outer membrane protein [Salinivirgaceae bacterium]
MMNAKKYSIVALVILMLASCTDEMLTLKPLGSDTTEAYYVNFENLDATATSAYAMLATRDVYDVTYSLGYQCAADDVEIGGENVNDWPQYQRIDRLTHTATESSIHRAWAYPYKGLRMINTVLPRIDDIKALEVEKAKSADAAEAIVELIDLRAAEMHFLSAFYHFTLLQLYGGVPIVNYLMDPEQFGVPRNSIAEVLHFIQDELRLAIPLLLEKSELGSNVGRASKGAAKALMAKVLLYESSYAENYSDDARFSGCVEKYDEALLYAEEVINSGQYGLVGIGEERFPSWRAPVDGTIGGYRWIFTVDGDNCDEGVWEVQNVNDGEDWTASRGNYITIYSTIRFYIDEDGNGGNTAGGWSFNLPSQYLLDAFGNNDTRETDLNSTVVDPELDPRFQTAIGVPGDTVLIAESGGGSWYEMDFVNLPTNTIGRKFECSPDEYWNVKLADQNGSMNIRLIRYADVVLMAAEAALKTQDNGKALGYVNQVRTRARNSGYTGYPTDLPAVSFEDIVHERRLELSMETSRFFDLVRWDLAEKFINGITLASMGDGLVVNYVKGKHEFFPIPAEELQKAPGLEQYDAWR